MNTVTTTIPQPPRRWLLRFGLPVGLLLAVAALLLTTAWSSIVPAPSVATATALLREVETEVVADMPIDEAAIVQAPGWVEAEPYSVYAGALAEGVVQEILVLEGDRVTKGQAVARLVPDEAQIVLRQMQAAMRTAEAQVTDANARLDVLAAQIEAARATTAALAHEYERKTTLVEGGAVAAGPVERLGFRVTAAEADVRRLLATVGVAKAGVTKAEAGLAKAHADHDLAALTLERMTVVSPIDGIVIERLTSPGSVVRFGNDEHASHVVHLYDPAKLQVRADVPLADVAMVGAGQPAEIVVDLLPDTVFTGEVLRFVHRADLQKNTVEAKVRINDPSELLKPDMLARVRILPAPASKDGEVRKQRLPRVLVPAKAVFESQVWILEGDDGDLGTARRRTVTTGPGLHEGWMEILDGVRPGERVILDWGNVSEGQLLRANATEHTGDSE